MKSRSPISRLYDAGIGFDGAILPSREWDQSQEHEVAVLRSKQLRWLSFTSFIFFVVTMYWVF